MLKKANRAGPLAGAMISLRTSMSSAPQAWAGSCAADGEAGTGSDQEGMVVRQPSDELAREDWRYRQPVTNQQVNTSK